MPAATPSLHVTLLLDVGAGSRTPVIEVDTEWMTLGAGDLPVEGRRLRFRLPGAEGQADAASRAAVCRVAPPLLAAAPPVQEQVLDTLLLFMITRAGRIPLHAAGFVLGDRTVLLAGPSGAGKSSVAFQAARAGLPLLGDDTVFLEVANGVRVWGFRRPMHVPVTGSMGATAAASSLRGGRWKQRVEPSSLVHGASPAHRNALCMLARGPHADAVPVPLEDAVAHVMATLEPGFDHFRAALPRALRILAADGCWRLTLDGDPANGLAVLRAALSEHAA